MRLKIAAISSFLALAGCNPNNPDDPLEPFNRAMHAFNKGADQVILNPVSEAYDAVTDDEVQQYVANASANLNEPRNAVNHVLQGEMEPALVNLTRFLYNSTMGVLGFGDPASNLGLFPQPTNFNQTLARWGVEEGPYVELPIFGPNTVRSTVAMLVDTQINPVTYNLSAEEYQYFNYFQVLSRVNDRARYGNLVEMLLYESADSYLATRLAYLQNQRNMEAEETGSTQSDTVELENFYE